MQECLSVQCLKKSILGFLIIIKIISILLTIQERQMCLIMIIRTMITVVDVTLIDYYY